MTDPNEHGNAIRNAASALSDAINKARHDGYEVDIEYMETRTIGQIYYECHVQSVRLTKIAYDK